MKSEDCLETQDLEKNFCKINKIIKEYRKEERLEIFIHGDIPDIDSDEIITLIDNIETTTAEQIVLTIMSRGGSLYSSIAIYNALMARRTDCQIITIANSLVASGAAVIFMAGSVRYSYKYSNFLIHSPSIEGYVSGKIENFNQEYNAINNLYTKLIKENFYPILSETDIEKMMNGLDIYMDTEEAIKKGLVHMVIEDMSSEEECEDEDGSEE